MCIKVLSTELRSPREVTLLKTTYRCRSTGKATLQAQACSHSSKFSLLRVKDFQRPPPSKAITEPAPPLELTFIGGYVAAKIEDGYPLSGACMSGKLWHIYIVSLTSRKYHT